MCVPVDRDEGVSDRDIDRPLLRRGRPRPWSRGALTSGLEIVCVAKNTVPTEGTHIYRISHTTKNITLQSRRTFEKLTHNSDRMGSKSWHALHVPFSFTSTLFASLRI